MQNHRTPAMLEAMHRLYCGLFLLTLACASSPSSPSFKTPQQHRDSTAIEQPSEGSPAAGSESSLQSPPKVPPETPTKSRAEGTIYRDELNRATQGGKTGYLLQQLAPQANRQNGRFYGWKITTLFPADPHLCANHCDIQVGDIILGVNGSPLERPEQLSTLVDSIPTMEFLEILCIRDQKLRKYRYSIIDRPK